MFFLISFHFFHHFSRTLETLFPSPNTWQLIFLIFIFRPLPSLYFFTVFPDPLRNADSPGFLNGNIVIAQQQQVVPVQASNNQRGTYRNLYSLNACVVVVQRCLNVYLSRNKDYTNRLQHQGDLLFFFPLN